MYRKGLRAPFGYYRRFCGHWGVPRSQAVYAGSKPYMLVTQAGQEIFTASDVDKEFTKANPDGVPRFKAAECLTLAQLKTYMSHGRSLLQKQYDNLCKEEILSKKIENVNPAIAQKTRAQLVQIVKTLLLRLPNTAIVFPASYDQNVKNGGLKSSSLKELACSLEAELNQII